MLKKILPIIKIWIKHNWRNLSGVFAALFIWILVKENILSLSYPLWGYLVFGSVESNGDANNRITVSDSASLDTNKLSITLWAFIDPAAFNGTLAVLVDKSRLTPSGQHGFFLILDDRGSINATNGVFFQVMAGGGVSGLQVSNVFPSIGWYHIVVSYDTIGTKKIYINAVDIVGGITRGSRTGSVTNNALDMVLFSTDVGSFPFTGAVQELIVFDGFMTQAIVDSLYNPRMFGQARHLNRTQVLCNLRIDDDGDGVTANAKRIEDYSEFGNFGTGSDGGDGGLVFRGGNILSYPPEIYEHEGLLPPPPPDIVVAKSINIGLTTIQSYGIGAR